MKAWLKGGLWGIIIGLILLIISILIILMIDVDFILGCPMGGEGVCSGTVFSRIFFPLFIFLMWPLILIGKTGMLYYLPYVVLGIALTLAYYFIIGTVIGLIITKIKSRKKKK